LLIKIWIKRHKCLHPFSSLLIADLQTVLTKIVLITTTDLFRIILDTAHE